MKNKFLIFINATILYILLLLILRLPFWQQIDYYISSFLINHRNNLLTQFFLVFTHLADSHTIIILLSFFSIILFIKKEYQTIIYFIGTSTFCGVLNSTIKFIVGRERPQISQLLYESSSSFPSGHSSAILSLVGNLIVYAFFKVQKRWLKFTLCFTGICIILLMGFSRMYLGVHWFSDILGGYVTALYSMLVTALLCTCINKFNSQKN